jgi:DNA ligase-1
MNTQKSSHEIKGLKNCLVDGFKHEIYNPKPSKSYYILTHFHSDHYVGLGSKWAKGLILCTPITANLLQNIIGVSSKLIVTIDVGSDFSIEGAQITFLSANHCPGSVMVLFQLDNGSAHLHTGDFRFCKEMKTLPIYKTVKIDILYLDTTYAHPKHTFMNQEQSIEIVLSSAAKFFQKFEKNGIVFISAYNLGKEKIIFALGDYFLDFKIYLDEKKMLIMSQIPEGKERIDKKKFTSNPTEANIHVVNMNHSGSLWPYFKPNFEKVESNLNSLNTLQRDKVFFKTLLTNTTIANNNNNNNKIIIENDDKNTTNKFTHALAFIPTGWSDASTYNKKNSVSTNEKKNITVQLIPYSEHSNCNELLEFVEFVHPRTLVPTVFSNVVFFF